MKKLVVAIFCLHLFMAGSLPSPLAQKVSRGRTVKDMMTNADVIRLVKLGVAEREIVEKIRLSKPSFDTSAKGLRQLRKARVGDRVINELLNSERAASVTSANDKGLAPCAPLLDGGRPAGDRARFGRLPPSRFHEYIRPDEAATHRLSPVQESEANQPHDLTKQMRIGTVRPLTPPLRTSVHGKCFDLGYGYDEILGIVSEGARQVRVRFASVAIPPNAKLFVYSMRDHDEIYGPYEGRGPSDDGTFWTPPIEGHGVVVEYYTPRPTSGSRSRRADFQITEVSHIY